MHPRGAPDGANLLNQILTGSLPLVPPSPLSYDCMGGVGVYAMQILTGSAPLLRFLAAIRQNLVPRLCLHLNTD